MKLKRLYFIGFILAVGLVFSAYYAKRLKDLKDTAATSPVVVVIPTPTAPPSVAPTPPEENPLANKVCEEQVEFTALRRELGLLVNDRVTRRQNPKLFAGKIEAWRKSHGLPLALHVDNEAADEARIVYNNCRPSCHGQVHQVFVTSTRDNKTAQVLGRDGHLKDIDIHNGAVDILIMDELNAKGVPFRSWPLPVDSGPWYLKDRNIYLGLDMEGVQLEVNQKGEWHVVLAETRALKLNPVEPLGVAGCTPDELCLQDFSKKRFFKIPRACEIPTKNTHSK